MTAPTSPIGSPNSNIASEPQPDSEVNVSLDQSIVESHFELGQLTSQLKDLVLTQVVPKASVVGTSISEACTSGYAAAQPWLQSLWKNVSRSTTQLQYVSSDVASRSSRFVQSRILPQACEIFEKLYTDALTSYRVPTQYIPASKSTEHFSQHEVQPKKESLKEWQPLDNEFQSYVKMLAEDLLFKAQHPSNEPCWNEDLNANISIPELRTELNTRSTRIFQEGPTVHWEKHKQELEVFFQLELAQKRSMIEPSTASSSSSSSVYFLDESSEAKTAFYSAEKKLAFQLAAEEYAKVLLQKMAHMKSSI